MSEVESKTPKAVIVGAGFTGLTLAYFLLKEGFKVRVIEKEDRVGGLISTKEISFGNGKKALAELAANGMIANRYIEELADFARVDLQATKKESRKRFILRNKRARRWPLGFFETFGFLFRVLKNLGAKKMKPFSTETVSVWGERVLGSKATEFLLAPALQGIYAGDIRKMKARLILGRFFAPKIRIRGKLRGTVAPRDGMEALLKGLYSELSANGVKFELSEDASQELAKVYENKSAIPIVASDLTSTVEVLKILAPSLSGHAKGVETLPLVTATLIFPIGAEVVSGFGCLFPKSENMNSLGVLVNSCIFENRVSDSFISETWILGGALGANKVFLKDEELLSFIESDRARLGNRAQPISWNIQKWPGTLPHFTQALENFINAYNERAEKDLYIVGNYMGSPGLGQIAVRNAELAQALKRKVKLNEK
ncbi:MAG: NAD(P)/FAD-dependent oxidoreductase [Pseudobdellovibrionaceae bacterium]